MTIELPDNYGEFLIKLGKELATQDNVHSSWPIWYVMEDKEVHGNSSGDYEHQRRKDSDYVPENSYCDSCQAILDGEDEDNEDLPEICPTDECSTDTYVYYDIERTYGSYGSTFFLTQKACQQHIDANSYHYTNPRPYADSAFRNEELQALIQALILLAGEKIPSNHYGKQRI